MADIGEAKWRQSPITSEGRASCGPVTQKQTPINTNKVRNSGWKDSGVADKMSRSWEKHEEQETMQLQQRLRLHTLFSSEKQKLAAPRWERFRLLWEQLRRSSSHLPGNVTKLARVFEKIAENFLIAPFVRPFPASLAGMRECHHVYRSSSGGGSELRAAAAAAAGGG